MFVRLRVAQSDFSNASWWKTVDNWHLCSRHMEVTLAKWNDLGLLTAFFLLSREWQISKRQFTCWSLCTWDFVICFLGHVLGMFELLHNDRQFACLVQHNPQQSRNSQATCQSCVFVENTLPMGKSFAHWAQNFWIPNAKIWTNNVRTHQAQWLQFVLDWSSDPVNFLWRQSVDTLFGLWIILHLTKWLFHTIRNTNCGNWQVVSWQLVQFRSYRDNVIAHMWNGTTMAKMRRVAEEKRNTHDTLIVFWLGGGRLEKIWHNWRKKGKWWKPKSQNWLEFGLWNSHGDVKGKCPSQLEFGSSFR